MTDFAASAVSSRASTAPVHVTAAVSQRVGVTVASVLVSAGSIRRGDQGTGWHWRGGGQGRSRRVCVALPWSRVADFASSAVSSRASTASIHVTAAVSQRISVTVASVLVPTGSIRRSGQGAGWHWRGGGRG